MSRNASLKKALADTPSVVPTSSLTPQTQTPQNNPREAGYVAGSYAKTTQVVARPEYAAFAETLRAAMLKQKLNASEVARRVWGSTKDKRGYDVARNRDRIGHYLAGTSYPEPENLIKLADVIGVPVEDLAVDKPVLVAGAGAPYRGRQPADVQITMLSDNLGKSRLQFDRVLDTDLALRIFQMLKDADHKALTVAMPPTGRSFGEPEPELRETPAAGIVAN
jgi:hypothetical protein